MSDITGITNLTSSSAGDVSLTGIKSAVGNLNTDKLEASDIANKATKVTSPTAGNFASLTAGGDLQDSGYKNADYAIASHTHTESGLVLSDNTTNDATASKHGFLPKLSGSATDILKGDGTFGAASVGSGFFGDGNDGTVTFDGSTTILGMAPSSSIYTLTRDLYLDVGTVNSGVTLETAGYRIFAKTSLSNAGTIKRTPNAGGNASGTTGGTAGAALAAGTMAGSVVGVAGKDGAASGGGSPVNAVAGNTGTSIANSINVVGVVGGYGGGYSGSTGRSATSSAGSLTASVQGARTVQFATSLGEFTSGIFTQLKAGSGSGSGGSGGTAGGSAATPGAGGGSGCSGGIVFISAKTLTNTGTISALGGAGGNGSAASVGNAGGGGAGSGGAGGVVILIYSAITLGTVTVTGGTSGSVGAGSGTGESGGTGTTGTTGIIYQFLI